MAQTDITRLNQAVEEMFDHIDRLVHNTHYNIKKKDAQELKDLVRSRMNVMLGIPINKRISTEDEAMVLSMIRDVNQGRKRAVIFEVSRCETALEEKISGTKFYYT